MNMVLEQDAKRYAGVVPLFQRLYRKAQNAQIPLAKKWYRLLFKLARDRRHIELAVGTSIGPGLYFGHAYCITINPAAVLGKISIYIRVLRLVRKTAGSAWVHL